jgi:hypothetical protein
MLTIAQVDLEGAVAPREPWLRGPDGDATATRERIGQGRRPTRRWLVPARGNRTHEKRIYLL